jgi:hypothetical protein
MDYSFFPPDASTAAIVCNLLKFSTMRNLQTLRHPVLKLQVLKQLCLVKIFKPSGTIAFGIAVISNPSFSLLLANAANLARIAFLILLCQ